jgi:hypothetical protein
MCTDDDDDDDEVPHASMRSLVVSSCVAALCAALTAAHGTTVGVALGAEVGDAGSGSSDVGQALGAPHDDVAVGELMIVAVVDASVTNSARAGSKASHENRFLSRARNGGGTFTLAPTIVSETANRAAAQR